MIALSISLTTNKCVDYLTSERMVSPPGLPVTGISSNLEPAQPMMGPYDVLSENEHGSVRTGQIVKKKRVFGSLIHKGNRPSEVKMIEGRGAIV